MAQQTFTGRKRVRKFFGHIKEVAEMPNLIEVQKASYDQFLLVQEPPGGRPDEGLQAVFKSVFPIKDFSNTSELHFVGYEFEHRRVGEVRDREHGLEHGLQPLVGPSARGLVDLQELVVGRLLNLDEVRHLCDFLDFSEKLTNALATNKSLRSCHLVSLSVEPSLSGLGRLSGGPLSIATVRTGVRRRMYLAIPGCRSPNRKLCSPPLGGAARQLMW